MNELVQKRLKELGKVIEIIETYPWSEEFAKKWHMVISEIIYIINSEKIPDDCINIDKIINLHAKVFDELNNINQDKQH